MSENLNQHAVAVIGLGNPLMSDEGIGVCVARELIRAGGLPDGVEVLDLGPGGLPVLYAVAGRRAAMFIDCAFMKERPGAIRRFTFDEVRSRKVQTRLSLHEGDLLHTLELGRALDECPEQLILFGIEPAQVGPGLELSPALRKRMPEYLTAVRNALSALHAEQHVE